MSSYQYIVIEGNIGAGKTTLTKMIAEKHNARQLLEDFADNPFLPKFYEEPDKYAFTLEMAFMADRYKQLSEGIQEQELFRQFTISDYYFMKSLIFSKHTLNNAEYKLYRQFFHIIYKQLPQPDLYVYLHHDIDRLLANIKKRGRNYEQNINAEYLTRVQNSYFDFFKESKGRFPFLIIDCSQIDFVQNSNDFRLLENAILEKEYSEPITRLLL
nr:MAG: hypothetical protein CSB03_00470 [Bacteroidia bacterium]